MDDELVESVIGDEDLSTEAFIIDAIVDPDAPKSKTKCCKCLKWMLFAIIPILNIGFFVFQPNLIHAVGSYWCDIEAVRLLADAENELHIHYHRRRLPAKPCNGTLNPIYGRAFIGGTVRSAEADIDVSFNWVDKICELFEECYVAVFENDSDDKTYEKLLKQQYRLGRDRMTVFTQSGVIYCYWGRCLRLAHSRNVLLTFAHQNFPHFDYFIMMDLDDVTSKTTLNRTVLERSLNQSDRWDVLTFNRIGYYDLWALRYGDVNINKWGGGGNQNSILSSEISQKLAAMDPNDFFPVDSAFNGFAVYKMNLTFKCYYRGLQRETSFNLIHPYEEVDHAPFHEGMRRRYKARIVISPLVLFRNEKRLTNKTTISTENVMLLQNHTTRPGQ